MNAAALDTLTNSPEALADEAAVMASFVAGKPLDPEVAKRVRHRGRQIREEIFRQHGLLDIAVPAIPELRGELPDSSSISWTVPSLSITLSTMSSRALPT